MFSSSKSALSFAPHFTDKKLANMSVQRTSSSNSSLSFVPQFTKENKVALSFAQCFDNE